MDFGTLKSRILAIIGRAPADICYELVTADINHAMRLQCMQATDTLTEAASIALPADFISLIDIYRDVDPRTVLSPTAPQALNSTFESSGTPKYYSILDGTITLSPAPDSAEDIIIRYYAKLADLSLDADTNDVLTNYPSIYLYGALTHHSTLIRDQAAAGIYAQSYAEAMRMAHATDQSNRYGGAPLTPMVRTAP